LTTNLTVKDRIREHWSARAASFDDEPGHAIDPDREAPHWRALFARALGPLEGRRVLDLACGTGQISQVLTGMGATVTGVDFAEPMLDRARARMAGQRWTGVQDDAEVLATQADGTFDAVVTRHLVWTLPDAPAAFRAWHRVLRPGGRVLIVDGNWRQVPAPLRLLRALADRLESPRDDGSFGHDYADLWADLSYGSGLTAQALRRDLSGSGFAACRVHSVLPIYLRGLTQPPLARRLRLLAARRFAMSAVRPG
jgi:SAM-dependent methyltransferase